MYLDENLARMNKMFNPNGFTFEKDGDIIRLVEDRDFLLYNSPKFKAYFKDAFKLKYNETYRNHIDYEGITILKTRKYKTEPSKDVDVLKKELFLSLGQIKEDPLRTSMEKYLTANDSFFEAPAALYWHHGYKAGLLEHTVQVLKLAQLVVENLDDDIVVDKDLVIAGIILHDIGKINCYQFENGAIIPTQILIEQGHIVNGIKIVSQNIESEKLDTIIHIIASHHNLPEWGSPITPKCNEAWIVHFIEDLSSKVMG